MTLQNEMEALRRFADSESMCNLDLPAGIWEFDRCFFIEIDGDGLYAEVDFHSQRVNSTGAGFDVDAWDREKFRLKVTPVNRQTYGLTYSLVRGLLSGRIAMFAGGVELSRASYLERMRKTTFEPEVMTIHFPQAGLCPS